MKYPPDSLRTHLNREVELRFTDGEVVHAKLLAVDTHEHDDLTYEVLRVIRPGVPPAKATEAGATIVAKLEELEHCQIVV
jgi:hypothetical protein